MPALNRYGSHPALSGFGEEIGAYAVLGLTAEQLESCEPNVLDETTDAEWKELAEHAGMPRVAWGKRWVRP